MRRYYRHGRDLSRGAKWGIGGVLAAVLGTISFVLFRSKTASAANLQAPGGGPQPATSIELRTVTTHDPPPSGDLIVFDAPNGNHVGGAEKDSTVELVSTAGDFVRIRASNPGGRYPAVEGFVHARFLT